MTIIEDSLFFPQPWDVIFFYLYLLLVLSIPFVSAFFVLYLIRWYQRNQDQIKINIKKQLTKLVYFVMSIYQFWHWMGPKKTYFLGYITYYLSMWFQTPLKQYNSSYMAHPYHNHVRPILRNIYKQLIILNIEFNNVDVDDKDIKNIVIYIDHLKNQKNKLAKFMKIITIMHKDKQVRFAQLTDLRLKVMLFS